MLVDHGIIFVVEKAKEKKREGKKRSFYR